MLISTVLFYVVAREKWKWSRLSAGIPVAIFLVTDFGFFAANLGKILHGAWFPLALGGAVMLVMTTWKRGRAILAEELRNLTIPFSALKQKMSDENVSRVRGHAVFLTGQPHTLPMAMLHNLEHNKTVHSNVLFLNFSFREVPRVPNMDKLYIEDLGSGFHHVTASYGFMESPSVPKALALALGQGLEVPIEETSYFLGREKLVINSHRKMSRWRAHFFVFLSRNAYDASTFFEIPEDRVIEVGIRLRI